jgi:hypothetical protein
MNKLFILFIFLFCSSCNYQGRVKMKAKLPTWIIYTSEWDFSNSADYTYDTNYISVTAGKATLLQVDQTHDSASEFSGGSHVGTVYSGGVLTLGNTGSCDGSSFNCA